MLGYNNALYDHSKSERFEFSPLKHQLALGEFMNYQNDTHIYKE
jgi:hypothetical protein